MWRLVIVALLPSVSGSSLLRHDRDSRLTVSSLAPARSEGFFNDDSSAMAELPPYNAMLNAGDADRRKQLGSQTPQGGVVNKGLWHPGNPPCHPKCTWSCAQKSCDEVCEPICPPPQCETVCKSSNDKCDTKCGAPRCAVVCPTTHCETGDCPKCKTVCTEPQCTTECSDDCESVCTPPVCSWKCKPGQCPEPDCKLNCIGLWRCNMDFPNSPKNQVPVLPGRTVVAEGEATLDTSVLASVGPPPPPFQLATPAPVSVAPPLAPASRAFSPSGDHAGASPASSGGASQSNVRGSRLGCKSVDCLTEKFQEYDKMRAHVGYPNKNWSPAQSTPKKPR